MLGGLKKYGFVVTVMIPIRKPCPWGQPRISLKGVKVDLEQKYWLCDEVIHHGRSAEQVAKWFDLKPRTVRRWVQHFKERGFLYANNGRPASFSPDDKKSIKAFCATGSCPPEPAKVKEFMLSLARKRKETDTNEYQTREKDVSRRVLRRTEVELNLRETMITATVNAGIKTCGEQVGC